MNLYPIPPMYSGVRYKYTTHDGNVPCEGKVPTDKIPSFDTLAGIPSVTRPQLGYCGPGCGLGCPQPSPFPPGGWHCYQFSPPIPSPYQAWPPGQIIQPPPGPGQIIQQPPMPGAFPLPLPPPPPPQPQRQRTIVAPYEQVNRNQDVIGARGNDYIPPGDVIDFYLFDHNVIRMYPQVDDVLTIKDTRRKFCKVNRRATWQELIDSVECKSRILEHYSYYPDRLIGVQELLPLPPGGGGGRFKLGPKIMLNDAQVHDEIGETWHEGYHQPRWLVRWPH